MGERSGEELRSLQPVCDPVREECHLAPCAFNELQRYLDEQYWQVVKFKLGKRAS